jgi:rhodanese-related sulfurtransferase
MKAKTALLYALTLILFLSCNSQAQQKTLLTPDEFEKQVAQPGIQVLDVRTAGEFQSGHLKNALQADWNKQDQFTERTKYIDKSKPVYVYCLAGSRSAEAAKWMRKQGFQQVLELDGGISSWKRAGKSLEGSSGEKALTMAELQEVLTKNNIVLADVGAEWCAPCRLMVPVLEQFLKENPAVFLYKIDGGRDTELMKQVNAVALPTFILYKAGKEIWRKDGIVTVAELKAALGN